MKRQKLKTAARLMLASILVCYGLFFAVSGEGAQLSLLGTIGAVGIVVASASGSASDLRKERAKCHDRMTELEGLIDKPIDDRPGKITNEQIDSEYTQLEARIGEIDKQIEESEKWSSRKKVSEERGKRLRQSQGIAAPPVRSGEQTGEPNGNRIEVHENIQDDPNKGFRTPREFLAAVIQAGRSGDIDNRLQYLTAGSDEARGNSDPAGGFLVPEGFSPNLLSIMPESDPIGGLTTKIPMTNPIVKIPSRVDTNHTSSVSGGLTVTRRPETVAGTSSQMTLSQVSLEANSLFGLSYASEELLTDSPISFAAILQAGFSDQFAGHLLNERLVGTGVGEFLGVLNSACLVTVSKEQGQAAATICKENVDKMRSRCWGYGKAVWLYNHDCLPQLRSLVQQVGTGGSSVPYFTVDANGNATLDGRPAFASEFCKTLGTVGDLILGNWSEFLEGTYEPLQSAESIHVRFVNHERTFKFWTRNAGQPWWKAALTPKNSTSTLSPFVALATR